MGLSILQLKHFQDTWVPIYSATGHAMSSAAWLKPIQFMDLKYIGLFLAY
jgi:hypothetical protein